MATEQNELTIYKHSYPNFNNKIMVQKLKVIEQPSRYIQKDGKYNSVICSKTDINKPIVSNYNTADITMYSFDLNIDAYKIMIKERLESIANRSLKKYQEDKAQLDTFDDTECEILK